MHSLIYEKLRGLVALAQQFDPDLIEQAAATAIQKHLNVTPTSFKALLHKIQTENQDNVKLTISENTQQYIRTINYFIHNSQ